MCDARVTRSVTLSAQSRGAKIYPQRSSTDDVTVLGGENMNEEPAPDALTVIGQLGTKADTLYPLFRAARTVDDLAPILRADGNFVLVYRRGADVAIVNSHYSLNNYFYTEHGGGFLHGETIQSLFKQGTVDQGWNFESIADLLVLEHLINNETLLRAVRAVPLGTILRWDGCKLVSRTYPWQSFREAQDGSARDIAHRLINLLLDGLRSGVGSRPLLTASAGLDSRVNLAGLLHLGIRPELAVIGQPGATDAEVVAAMGRGLGLAVHRIVAEPRDYLAGAGEIARLTNGVKPLNHWHTWVFASKAGYGAGDRVFTGTNGEHVRAVGFDYGALAVALDGASRIGSQVLTQPLLRKFFALKQRLPIAAEELAHCAPEFRSYYGSSRQVARFISVIPHTSFVRQCDSFVLEQRRKGFQAAGLQLYRSRFPVYSPFMNKSWIDAGWSLPLSWRLDSRWHRYTVQRLFPRLTEFAEEKDSAAFRVNRRPLYWIPAVRNLRGSSRVVPYVDYDNLLRRDDVLALLHDHAGELDGVMTRGLVYRLVDDHRRTGRHTRALSVLTGIAVWRASLR